MKLIKLDRRHHGFAKWTHALEFTKREVHMSRLTHVPYVRAFSDLYGEEYWHNTNPNVDWQNSIKWNENWRYDRGRRRIYFKDPSILTFVELKIA